MARKLVVKISTQLIQREACRETFAVFKGCVYTHVCGEDVHGGNFHGNLINGWDVCELAFVKNSWRKVSD